MSIQPLFRWAGGKNRYVTHLSPFLLPRPVYVEPFFGAGAVFCYVANQNIAQRFIINDTNKELCELYQTIKIQPEQFIKDVERFQAEYLPKSKEERKEFYYNLRSAYWETPTSSLLFFLLKTSFNGIWQTCISSKGLFGTPCGLLTEVRPFVDADQIRKWSAVLQHTTILTGDFSCVSVPKNSLVYCDPPYRDSFTTYGTAFNDDDQARVLSWCESLADSVVILSNKSDGTFFEQRCTGNIVYFDATHTAGRRKQHISVDGKVSHTATKAREMIMTWNVNAALP